MKPNQRKLLSRLGAVRLSREEARNIIMMKKKAINFFAAVMVQRFVYLDDVAMPVDQANRAYASTFEFYLEYGTEHIAK
eukprot:13950654-Heterocapsa_arctica.AAC.1